MFIFFNHAFICTMNIHSSVFDLLPYQYYYNGYSYDLETGRSLIKMPISRTTPRCFVLTSNCTSILCSLDIGNWIQSLTPDEYRDGSSFLGKKQVLHVLSPTKLPSNITHISHSFSKSPWHWKASSTGHLHVAQHSRCPLNTAMCALCPQKDFPSTFKRGHCSTSARSDWTLQPPCWD